MDNINVAVLIVALIFVAAGVTLIALSALVGRGGPTPSSEDGATERLDPEAAPDTEPEVLFIDEPLTTDLAQELGGAERGRRVTTTEAPEASDTTEAAADTTEAPEASDAEVDVAARADASATTPAVAPAAPETPARDEAPAAGTPRPGPFDFSVQLGFKYLENGLTTEAAAEFQKAAQLTDDRQAKLALYTRIGDTLRERGLHGPAYAAYLQATAYADDPDAHASLERAISDMTDAGPDSGRAADPSGNKKE